MSLSKTLTTWATRRHQRRVEFWSKQQETMSSSLTSWRTPARQRLLVTLYFASLAAGLLIAIGQLFWSPLLLGWILFTLFMMIAWTMLRITINAKDDAPSELLDEYEETVINSWRKISYSLIEKLFTLGLVFLVTFSALTTDTTEVLGHSPMQIVFTVSLIGLIGFLAIAALPAVGYAMTFTLSDDMEEAA